MSGSRAAIAGFISLCANSLAQLALIPARDRSFPETVELAHDFPAWQAAVLAAKRDHGDRWTEVVPRLSSFGPASFTVDDPQSVAALGLGMALVYDPDSDWELDSPMARPMRFRHTFQA